MRSVVDCRALNQLAKTGILPLTVIFDMLRSFGTLNTLFAATDIKSAFWQMELPEESKEFTAFANPTGHYKLKCMSFVLSSTPFTFVSLMNNVL